MKYLLTFKPLKNFFFGNNKTFSDDYLAISEYFPQNTQLLGALRLYIAEQQGLMKVYKKGKWCNEPEVLKSITGTATSKDFISNDNLGKINNLSQIFIVNKIKDDAYFPIPFDIEIKKESVRYYELTNIDDEYFLKDYDVKNSSNQRLGNKLFWDSYINKDKLSVDNIKQFNNIFSKYSQVGIELENKQTVDKKFYSKVDYMLKDDFIFGCLFDFDDELHDGIIQIGAESSLFDMKVEKYEETKLVTHPVVSQLFSTPQKGDKIVCLSDTILESTNKFNSYFTIVPYFKNFAMLDKTKSKHNGKTEQKRVIPTGTVSYIKEQKIPYNSIGAYSKIGYNQFITVKK